MPLDVGNFRGGSNVDMKMFWYIIYMTSAFFIIVILPFALFYYESDDDILRGAGCGCNKARADP